jgi:hypothetical protein
MCAVAGGYIDDPNHDWFAHQRNSAGKFCCEIADGHRVDDADWKSDGAGITRSGLTASGYRFLTRRPKSRSMSAAGLI